jgi:hypothetical protein
LGVVHLGEIDEIAMNQLFFFASAIAASTIFIDCSRLIVSP